MKVHLKLFLGNILFIIFCCISYLSSAQTYQKNFSIFFEPVKYDITEENATIINQNLESLKDDSIVKVTVRGHTDNSSDSIFNMKLARKRTTVVKLYLFEHGIDQHIISTLYFGENLPLATNETEEGKKQNRRVDIVIVYKQKNLSAEKIDTLKTELKIDNVENDTLIKLPQGTQLIFNKSEFLELQNCLEFEEALSTKNILLNGLTTMSSDGFPLSSCGILHIKLKPGCREKHCFNTPVKVLFPVHKDSSCNYCLKNASVWNLLENLTWESVKDIESKIKLITVDGIEFYQFNIICPDYYNNCDCKPKSKPVKFKTKKSLKFINATISYECPVVIAKVDQKEPSKKNLLKIKLPCFEGNKFFSAIAINKIGDTLVINNLPLSALSKKVLFSKCPKTDNQIETKFLGLIPIHKRNIYRKYMVKPNQFSRKN